MLFSFSDHTVRTFIGINGMFPEIVDVFFEKADHLWWKRENCHFIDEFMRIKPPGTGFGN
jgi:hypothetical protein